MATIFQGFETLEIFNRIFLFLLILFVLYAILQRTKVIGENNSVQAVIAFAVALILASSGPASTIILNMTPAFVVLFFFILFMLMAVKIFGYSDESIWSAMKEREYLMTTIVIVGIVIALSAVAGVFGQGLLEKNVAITTGNEITNVTSTINIGEDVNTGNFQENLWNTLFNPRVLGMVVIILISMFAIKLITEEEV